MRGVRSSNRGGLFRGWGSLGGRACAVRSSSHLGRPGGNRTYLPGHARFYDGRDGYRAPCAVDGEAHVRLAVRSRMMHAYVFGERGVAVAEIRAILAHL